MKWIVEKRVRGEKGGLRRGGGGGVDEREGDKERGGREYKK